MASISCPDVAKSWIIRHEGHLDLKILNLVLRDHRLSDREPQTILLSSGCVPAPRKCFSWRLTMATQHAGKSISLITQVDRRWCAEYSGDEHVAAESWWMGPGHIRSRSSWRNSLRQDSITMNLSIWITPWRPSTHFSWWSVYFGLYWPLRCHHSGSRGKVHNRFCVSICEILLNAKSGNTASMWWIM